MTGIGMKSSRERSGGRAAVVCLAGLIVLVWSGVCVADVLNGSFETTYPGLPWPRPLPRYWARIDHPSFNSYCASMWSTDGQFSASLFSRLSNIYKSYNFEPGDCQSFLQYVDLTGIGSIVFDVRLAALPSGVFKHFEASLLVGGVPLWKQTGDGVHPNQKVNVSHLAGWHLIEIRNTALESGTFDAAYWTQWDNLRLVEGSETIEATITLEPATLSLASNGRWVTAYIELPEGYDVRSIDGSTVKLGDIAAHTGDEGWATDEANDGNIMDHDGDDILERMVKFERAAVQEAIAESSEATVTVTGGMAGNMEMAGVQFEGAATIQVVDKGGKKG